MSVHTDAGGPYFITNICKLIVKYAHLFLLNIFDYRVLSIPFNEILIIHFFIQKRLETFLLYMAIGGLLLTAILVVAVKKKKAVNPYKEFRKRERLFRAHFWIAL